MQGQSLYDTRVRKLVQHFESMDNETEGKMKKIAVPKTNKNIYDDEGKVRSRSLSDDRKKVSTYSGGHRENNSNSNIELRARRLYSSSSG